MRRTLIVIVLVVLAACARRAGGPLAPDADPASLPSLAGDYALNGLDVNGAEYGGRLTITPNADGTYRLQWLVFESIQEGTGVIQGNRLKVNWRTVDGFPNPLSGTASYTITAAGELFGAKVIEGFAGEAQETAYPNSPENMSR